MFRIISNLSIHSTVRSLISACVTYIIIQIMIRCIKIYPLGVFIPSCRCHCHCIFILVMLPFFLCLSKMKIYKNKNMLERKFNDVNNLVYRNFTVIVVVVAIFIFTTHAIFLLLSNRILIDLKKVTKNLFHFASFTGVL